MYMHMSVSNERARGIDRNVTRYRYERDSRQVSGVARAVIKSGSHDAHIESKIRLGKKDTARTTQAVLREGTLNGLCCSKYEDAA